MKYLKYYEDVEVDFDDWDEEEEVCGVLNDELLETIKHGVDNGGITLIIDSDIWDDTWEFLGENGYIDGVRPSRLPPRIHKDAIPFNKNVGKYCLKIEKYWDGGFFISFWGTSPLSRIKGGMYRSTKNVVFVGCEDPYHTTDYIP